MYMANGATFNGELSNTRGVSGNYTMSNPIHPNGYVPFSCYFFKKTGSFSHIPTPTTFFRRKLDKSEVLKCRDAFINDLNGRNLDQWVDLMIQYKDDDPGNLTFAVTSRTWDGENRLMYMEGKFQAYGRTQNIRTVFSIIQSESNPLTAEISMGDDWFYYTPDTNISIWQVLQDVSMLRGRRLNTTGLSLVAPVQPQTNRPADFARPTLVPPSYSRNYWAAILPNGYTNNYQVFWSHRSKGANNQTWSDWTQFSPGTLKYEVPQNLFFQGGEVEVRVRYNIQDQNGSFVDQGETRENRTSTNSCAVFDVYMSPLAINCGFQTTTSSILNDRLRNSKLSSIYSLMN